MLSSLPAFPPYALNRHHWHTLFPERLAIRQRVSQHIYPFSTALAPLNWLCSEHVYARLCWQYYALTPDIATIAQKEHIPGAYRHHHHRWSVLKTLRALFAIFTSTYRHFRHAGITRSLRISAISTPHAPALSGIAC